MNTVGAKRSKYSARDYSRGVNARKLQEIIGRPGLKKFLEILDGGIPKYPVRRDYALATEEYFGTNIH